MAVWQYDVHVIPRSALEEWHRASGSTPTHIDEDSLEGVNWWRDVAVEEVTHALSVLLPLQATNWDPQTISWGADDGHRIDLSSDGQAIKELMIRIDVRNLSDGFLSRLLQVLGDLDCVVVSAETHQLFEPRKEALLEDLLNSSAQRFVDDPQGFLDRLSAGEIGKKRLH